MILVVPVSVGELVDKITILQIKQQHITDSDKLKNINTELSKLLKIIDTLDTKNIDNLQHLLLKVNQELWDLEEFKRRCEQSQTFDNEFLFAARQVCLKNDLRADIKRQINFIMNSDIMEEKSY